MSDIDILISDTLFALKSINRKKKLTPRSQRGTKRAGPIQWYSTLRPPTLRPVFKEIAKICHHKIFHFKAGFTIKFYFDSKLGTCHQRNRYLRNRIPRNNYLRNGILRNSHLRNRILRNNYSRNKNPPQDFELHQSGVNL
jgi:hypothetical protein